MKDQNQDCFKIKIYEYLDRLPAGMVSVYKICKRETMPEFIEIVKKYIDERGNYNGYCTEFSNDYSSIKKFDIILRTPADKLKESLK